MNNGAEVFTVKEVARLLRTSPWQIYAHVRSGVLPSGVVIRLGRSIRFNRRALQEWLADGGRGLQPGEKLHAASEQLLATAYSEGGRK